MHHLPKFVWRLMQFGPLRAYQQGQGARLGHLVLILTTTGRKSGLPRQTPLQYEEEDGAIYVASARGAQADWFRNVAADPRVEVQIGERRFHALAEPITDPARIADFLELRYRRHPRMVGAMLRTEGFKVPPERAQLERYAAKLAMVGIRAEAGETSRDCIAAQE